MINKKGVTLLLAVLVSSIALSVGVGIFSLLFSELEISGSVKDSVTAFYAGDSGLECALYWDVLKNKDNSAPDPFSGSPNSITCNEKDPPYITGSDACDQSAGDYCTGEFYTEYSDGNSCAHVIVEKQTDTDGYIITRLISAGENRKKCNEEPSSSRTVQQGLKITY